MLLHSWAQYRLMNLLRQQANMYHFDHDDDCISWTSFGMQADLNFKETAAASQKAHDVGALQSQAVSAEVSPRI